MTEPTLPSELVEARRTPLFEFASLPDQLAESHRTTVWAELIVQSGSGSLHRSRGRHPARHRSRTRRYGGDRARRRAPRRTLDRRNVLHPVLPNPRGTDDARPGLERLTPPLGALGASWTRPRHRRRDQRDGHPPVRRRRPRRTARAVLQLRTRVHRLAGPHRVRRRLLVPRPALSPPATRSTSSRCTGRSTTPIRSRRNSSIGGSTSSTTPSTADGPAHTRTKPRSGRPEWHGPWPNDSSAKEHGDPPNTAEPTRSADTIALKEPDSCSPTSPPTSTAPPVSTRSSRRSPQQRCPHRRSPRRRRLHRHHPRPRRTCPARHDHTIGHTVDIAPNGEITMGQAHATTVHACDAHAPQQ